MIGFGRHATQCVLWLRLLGAGRWLLFTSRQAHAGCRRRDVAGRRLQFLPEIVRPMLLMCGWNMHGARCLSSRSRSCSSMGIIGL